MFNSFPKPAVCIAVATSVLCCAVLCIWGRTDKSQCMQIDTPVVTVAGLLPDSPEFAVESKIVELL